MEKDLILNELNSALQEYHNGNNQKDSYNCLFIPVQKANRILINERIFIFPKTKNQRDIPENKNPNYYLKDLSLKAIKPRNIILEDNLGLVGKVADKYNVKLYDITFDEIKSEGVFGLLKAIAKFNPHLNVPFQHYASVVIANHLKISLNEYLRTIKPPVNFIFNYRLMIKFEDEFKEKFTKKPNNEELAEFIGKPVKYVERLKENNKKLYDTVSLDTTPMFQVDDENYLIDNIKNYLIDYIIDINSFFEDRVIDNIIFDDFIKDYILKLPKKNREVLFEQLKGKTLEYIAFCPEEPNLRITDSKKIFTRERIRQISADGIQEIKASKEFKKKTLEFNLF